MSDEFIEELSDAKFESQVLDTKEPAVVGFGSPWSGPSRRVKDHFAELSEEFDSVKSAWINVDDNPQVAGNYGVKSLPTVLLFHDGRAIERRIGASTCDEIRELFEMTRDRGQESESDDGSDGSDDSDDTDDTDE